MTNDFNILLEQYNLSNYDCDGDFDEYYWQVAEFIEHSIFTVGTIERLELIDAMTELLDIDEDDINIDQIDSFLDEVFELVRG